MKAPFAFPPHISIGPSETKYNLKFVYIPRAKFLGKCSFKKQLITINANQNPEAIFMTFIHEVLHAIEFETGDRMPHKHIYRFEQGLYFLFKNNISQFTFNYFDK